MTDRVGECWTCGFPFLRPEGHASWCAPVSARRLVLVSGLPAVAGFPPPADAGKPDVGADNNNERLAQ